MKRLVLINIYQEKKLIYIKKKIKDFVTGIGSSDNDNITHQK